MPINIRWQSLSLRQRFELEVASTERGPRADLITYPLGSPDDAPPLRVEFGPLARMAPSIRNLITSQEFTDLLCAATRDGDDPWLLEIFDTVFPHELTHA